MKLGIDFRACLNSSLLKKGGNLEIQILDFIQTLHNPILDQIMIVVTSLADHGWLWIVIGIVLASMKKYRRYGIALLLALLLGFLAGNVLLKNLFMRPRPNWVYTDIVLLIQNPADFSFPSGHSQASFAGAVSLCYLNRKLGIAAICLAAVIAFSRMYLYVHYPTDVLAGMLLGILWAFIAFLIIGKWEEKKHAKGNCI